MTSTGASADDVFFFGRLSANIANMCTCVKRAVREYYELPAPDQNEVWDDLTGQGARGRVFLGGKEFFSEEHEPPNLVKESLLLLENELTKRVGPEDPLSKAQQQSPTYVDDNFRLKFLRAEKFNAKAAAIRMTRHFQEKLCLFGEDKLGREIMLSDLDEDDMDSLSRSYFQVLPEPDHSNRKVLFYYKAISDCYRKRDNILRAVWYVVNVISLDEDVQKLGVVNVVYNVGGFPKHGMDYEKSRRLSNVFRALPVRFNSFFVCLDEGAWLTVVNTFSVMISQMLRIRLRVIQGNHDEVQQKLKAVGVPSETLPVNDQNELLIESHLSWVERRKEAEKKESADPPLQFSYENCLTNTNLVSDMLQSTASHYSSELAVAPVPARKVASVKYPTGSKKEQVAGQTAKTDISSLLQSNASSYSSDSATASVPSSKNTTEENAMVGTMKFVAKKGKNEQINQEISVDNTSSCTITGKDAAHTYHKEIG